MQFKPINREWVKNAAIVFLAVLLVLTFFSNTIMNRTLPEVATQYVTDGAVTARVRGTGTVVANGSHQVKADADREIRSVMVRVGQEVNAGDVLFVLGGGSADELEQAQEELRQLQISYQRAAISSPTFNYSTSERKVKDAYQTWQDALKKVDEEDDKLPDDENKEAIEKAETILADAKKQLKEMEETVQAEQQAAMLEVEEAQKAYDDLLAASHSEEPAPTSPSATESLDSADSLPSPQVDMPETSPTEPGPTVISMVNRAPKLVLLSSGPDELQKAKERLDKAIEALAALNAGPDPRITMAQTLVDTAQAQYDALTNSPERQAYNAALAAAKEAENAYYDLKDALDTQKTEDGKSQALAGLEMSDIAAQIERKKQQIEELSGGDGNQVTANVSGLVESIECTAGDLKLKGDVLCTIEVPDQGYTLSFSVTNDQARRLSPGDTASVTNYYWGSQIDATLSTIRVDPKSPQTNKLLTFDLEGDVNAGSEITLSVGQRSANYDTIVPNSAIRSDTNGQFVLAVESRSSPLGNRYIARRVDVEVLAADDINSAVTGDLGYGTYVITTSNAPVNNGDMVRMADT